MNGRALKMSVRATLLACVMGSGVASAQTVDPAVEVEAQTLLDAAIKLMADKQFAPACRKLEVVVGKIPRAPGARLALARCYRGEGRLASAWNQYTQTETLARGAGQADRATEAAKGAAELAPLLGKLQIDVLPEVQALPGLNITLNGNVQAPATWGTAFPVDAMEHEIAASADGRKPWSTHFIVRDRKKGEESMGPVSIRVPMLEANKTILRIDSPPDITELREAVIRVDGEIIDPLYWKNKGGDVKPGPHEVEVIAPGRERWQTSVVIKEGETATVRLEPLKELKRVEVAAKTGMRVAGFVGIGLGIVGVGAGAVLGGLSASKNNASNDGHCDAQNRCDQTGYDLRKEAQSFQLGGAVAGILGTVVLAGGVALVIVSTPKKPTTHASLLLGPASIGIRGQW